MAYIKKLDNFVNETSIAVYPPRGSKRVERLGAEEYMDMGNPDSKDFNDTLKPFKYKNCWLYPVAAMYRTFDKAYADKIKQCTAKKNDMSWCPLNDDFDAEDFGETLEKYGYGKCEVFAYRSKHTGIDFYTPVNGGSGSSDYFAEYDLLKAGKFDWREVEYKLNKIFDKCCPETAYWAKVESRVNEALRRGNSDDYRFYVVSQNEADKLAGEYGSVEAIPNDVFIREAEAEGTVYSIDGFADAYNNMDLPTVGYSVLRILPKIVYSKVSESRASRGGRTLNESKLLDAIRKYDSDKLDSIEALVHNEYSLTLDGLIALYKHFYSNDISFFTEFLEYTGDRGNDWLKDGYEWWDFIKTYVAYKLLDDINIEKIVQAIIDEEYANYISNPDDIFEDFNRNETGKWAEGICAELGIQAPEMED